VEIVRMLRVWMDSRATRPPLPPPTTGRGLSRDHRVQELSVRGRWTIRGRRSQKAATARPREGRAAEV